MAGAGSGKTFTIASKVAYLIQNGVSPSEILSLSFTNETVNNLKAIFTKNNIDVEVYTYHKLALNLLKNKYKVAAESLLEYIAKEYFYSFIYLDSTHKLLDYLVKDQDKDQYIEILSKTISTFIHYMKIYNKTLNNIREILKINMPFEDKCLIIFAFKIYLIYQEELESSFIIDFDDMINLAIKEVDSISKISYKYIIIDEYQDISYSKYLLIKKLKDKFNMRLIGVGDDYQAIYSFSGSDPKYFLEFKKMFPNSKMLKLKNNYRNPKDIVEISKRIVLKNNIQIKKRLLSKKIVKDSINVVYFEDEKETVLSLISDLDDVLVLGRNNKDLSELETDNKNIRFLTVHKSKGLEADYVIILNVIDDILGFPNKIKENNVLKYIVNRNYQIEEERRLFYVALTRARKKVFILTKKDKESIYVKELIKDYRRKINIIKRK